MASILVGWELGGERGHVTLLAPIVAALRARGHQVAVALKDLDAASGVAALAGPDSLFQAPTWPAAGGRPLTPDSQTVGDDMVTAGLADAAAVLVRARAWASLLASLQVDLVLAETAPTLLLAARRRCRAIAFGTGYSLPVAGRPLPPALDVQRPPAAGSAAAEEALRQAYDSADRALGGQGLARFSDLFAVPNWVCNLVELDPYSSLRPAPAAGPLQLPSAAGADGRRSGPPGPGANVFVYAKPSPALPTLMDALAPRCRQLELFIGNAPAHIQNPWPHVRLHRTPVDLSARLPEFSAVVHFGGMNLAAEALFAGVPQLVLPHHLEQAATGMAVQRLGTGHCLATFPMEPEQEPARHSLISGLVDRFFADTGLPARAAALGADLRGRQKPSLEGLVALCEAGF